MNYSDPSSKTRTARVREVADSIQYGHTASAVSRQDGPRFLRITDIQNGIVDWDTVPSCDIAQEDIAKYRLSEGDLVFARTGATTGKSFLIRDCPDAVFASYLIRVRASKTIDPRCLAYFFQSPDYWRQIEEGKRGIGQPNVNGKVLGEIKLPLRPLDEQQRIVSEIEKQFTRLDAGVISLKRVQMALKRYRISVLKAACEGRLVPTEAELARKENRSYQSGDKLLLVGHTRSEGISKRRRAGRLWGAGHVPELTDDERSRLPIGWAWTKVRDVGSDPEDTVQVGPMSMQSKDFTDDGVPVLNVGCVQWGHFDESKLNHLPPKRASDFDRYRIQPGDILFTRSGTVGRCAVAQPHQNGWLMTFHLLRARPNPQKCLSDFLRIVFEGGSHIRRQTRAASVGSHPCRIQY